MNPLRVMIVLIAAVSAIGLAVVMQKALGGKAPPAPVAQASAPVGKPMTQVLVAKRDLADRRAPDRRRRHLAGLAVRHRQRRLHHQRRRRARPTKATRQGRQGGRRRAEAP
jgi:hypothetical protein